MFQSVGKEPQMNADKRSFIVLVLEELIFNTCLMKTLRALRFLIPINNELKRTDTNLDCNSSFVSFSSVRYLYQIETYRSRTK